MRLLIAATLVLLWGCASPIAPRSPVSPDEPKPLVILVSIDGLRPDYIERGFTPTLSRLAREGVRAEAMRPSFPSLTFPNHYTIVTGLRPDRNGIVNNQMEDPEHPGLVFTLRNRKLNTLPFWWEDAAPLWVSAEQQGVRTATMFWPGSEVAIHGVRPRDWVVFDQALPSLARVETVLGWLDRPAADRPAFVTLYFDIVDTAGHRFGPDSPQVNEAAREVDGAIDRLISGLAERGLDGGANIVIVSDHGMSAVAPDRVVDLDAIVAPSRVRYVWPPGPLAGIEPIPGHVAEVEATLLGRHGNVECWRREALPAHFHAGRHPRSPPIICVADVGWTLLSSAYPRTYPVGGGAHGYDPDDPSMAAVFIATGPAFRSDVTLPAFDNVHVYPLLARLMGVTAKTSDGDITALDLALH